MATTYDYDVIVIGGGTAGSNAARTASENGAKTALVHLPNFWNLCVELGCMPSKSLLGAAEAAHGARNPGVDGVRVDGSVAVDFQAVLARKDRHIERFLKGLTDKLESEAYDIIEGTASFRSEDELEIQTEGGQARTLSAKRYVIATGSIPFVPPIEGIESVPYVTSDDIMRNTISELPDSMIILGGGAIGLEMATFFSRMGTEVAVVERAGLMKHLGEDVSKELRAALEDEGITVVAPASVTAVAEDSSGGVVCTVEQNGGGTEARRASHLLVATGRKPNVEGLGLENVGLEATKEKLACDEHTRTANERIYAAGDVTKEMQILHVASHEGEVAGSNAAAGAPERAVDYDLLSMQAVFTDPALAHLGHTEAQAKEQGYTTTVVHSDLPNTGRAITMSISHGLWKLVVDAATGTILGATILGPRADDLIHEVFLAMRLGATVHDLAALYAYHPTLSEQFISLAADASEQIKQ